MLFVYGFVLVACAVVFLLAKVAGQNGCEWSRYSTFIGWTLGIAAGLLLIGAGVCKPDDPRSLVNLVLTFAIVIYFVIVRAVHGAKYAEYARSREVTYKYAGQRVSSSASYGGVYYGR